jgi:N-carbamoyl-L-amino-acid hydrolase
MTITRRTFLGLAAAAPGLSYWPSPLHRAPAQEADAGGLRVDGQRLKADLEALSVHGRPPGGSFAAGVSRVAYSDADIEGRRLVSSWMREARLRVRIDTAGNIIGRRDGRRVDAPPILFGSHLDSVPNGGNFDGPLGTLSAIEVVRALERRGVITIHPLEVVAWANEEGVAFGNGLCGSRAVAGELAPGELDQVWNGMTMSDAIRRIGGDPVRIGEARRAPGSIRAYLELHIEQGGTLDREGVPIGVVEGIVAIDRYDAVIGGEPNHAGTTPMPDRHDALVAASQLVLAVREVVTSEAGRQVGTVGQLAVTPNAPNVVPGLVRHTIELRDLSAARIARLAGQIRARAAGIAARTGTTIEITATSHHEAALADPGIQHAIERTASGLGLRSVRLPSGAGHDAQMAARLGPMGMIFVPSVGGVSHSPKELTRWEDCTRGAAVLLNAVLAIDRAR